MLLAWYLRDVLVGPFLLAEVRPLILSLSKNLRAKNYKTALETSKFKRFKGFTVGNNSIVALACELLLGPAK